MKTLRLILGDQLNYRHSWYQQPDDEVLYVLMEMRQETDYVRHHLQKIIGFFAAMYNFARFLQKKGHRVVHLRINDPQNRQSLTKNLEWLISQHQIEHFEYQLPDEYRLDAQLKTYCQNLPISHQVYDTEHFYTSRYELAEMFRGKKTYLMETFYRTMRKKHNVMMNGSEPIGGQWNYDGSNRKPFKGQPSQIPIHQCAHDYREIEREIQKAGVSCFGRSLAERFPWPTTRKQCLEALAFFLRYLFPHFGDYQDAMHSQHWVLFHSKLSFGLNTKMISPQEVVHAAIAYWQKHPERVSVEQCEGFVRQILGWREYVRGIYWAQMPQYASLNFFGHTAPLPSWFWTGQTRMNCLAYAIGQSLEYAYAHHIQRLMVTGNFALLAGIHPDEVDQWYLGIYIDAIEWVEITNTRGMSQFADGGIVGSKPYVSSANYIDKMSNYCATCFYDKKQKIGPKACPFNSLYWHFYERNRPLLERNPRIGMMYQILNKMPTTDKQALLNQAEYYLKEIEEL
ncbi:MAG: cryptochrome/photolyase family protein [Runella sp.]